MNPADLGVAFDQAVEHPSVAGQRFVIGAYTPYVAADAAALRSMPEAVVERYYPGVPRILDELGIEIPSVPFYFNHARARARLGFRSQHDLGSLVRSYQQWRQAQ